MDRVGTRVVFRGRNWASASTILSVYLLVDRSNWTDQLLTVADVGQTVCAHCTCNVGVTGCVMALTQWLSSCLYRLYYSDIRDISLFMRSTVLAGGVGCHILPMTWTWWSDWVVFVLRWYSWSHLIQELCLQSMCDMLQLMTWLLSSDTITVAHLSCAYIHCLCVLYAGQTALPLVPECWSGRCIQLTRQLVKGLWNLFSAACFLHFSGDTHASVHVRVDVCSERREREIVNVKW